MVNGALLKGADGGCCACKSSERHQVGYSFFFIYTTTNITLNYYFSFFFSLLVLFLLLTQVKLSMINTCGPRSNVYKQEKDPNKQLFFCQSVGNVHILR